MSMLAEPRRKQKWSLNPRGKQWSEDSNKFGQKMLERMGWTSGKGLGVREQGMIESIRVKYKDDQAGLGYNKNVHENEWVQHQDGFNDLLKNLQKNQNSEPDELMETKDIALSGESLEFKSKQSRARVHYQKFTRSKDVNNYTEKDLANIFGKKSLNNGGKNNEEVKEDFISEPIGSQDTTAGVLTVKGGNMSEYFQKKIPSIMGNSSVGKQTERESSDTEEDRYVGFGFSNTNSDRYSDCSENVYSRTNDVFENRLTVNPSPIKPPRKRKSATAFSNEGFDLNYIDRNNSEKKIETKLEVPRASDCFINPALDLDCSVNEIHNGTEFEVSRPVYDNDNTAINTLDETVKKKRKKHKKNVDLPVTDGFVNPALNLDCPVVTQYSGTEFEVPRVNTGLVNDALDISDEDSGRKRVTFNDVVEFNTDIMKKKKPKRKLDKFEVENSVLKRKKKCSVPEESSMIFVNEALEVDTTNEEIQDNELNERKCRKEKRKRGRRISNLETIIEFPEEEKDDNVEIIREIESINVHVEPEENCQEETPRKSKKKKKKKKKKEKKPEMIEEGLNAIKVFESVPDEFSVIEDYVSETEKVGQEPRKGKVMEIREEKEMAIDEIDKENQNDVHQKIEKKKKREKSLETCEFFLDEDVSLQEETLENSLEQVTPKIKKSKRKCPLDSDTNVGVEEKLESADHEEASAKSSQSPYNILSRKSKKVLKAMFSKSLAVEFKGSNINDIKGYGVI